MSKKTPLSLSALETIITTALEDAKAQNITVIDVTSQTSIADKFIIASATSNRHMMSVAENVSVSCKKNGEIPLGIEGNSGSEWVLVDLADIIVHIMLPKAREYYDLESLWSHTLASRNTQDEPSDDA